ncbi:MAG: hypothetical protein KDA31_14880 [Phycisphaerales bacterium]|nr:hypothetical protein [Phycisphaerales bacterium]MCB9835820.1 hypothetical protein [Phycisphaera sp.]
MNDQLHPEPNDRRDVLIGRIIDGEATGQDWAEFRQLAGDDESVFAEIAELQDLRKRTIDIVEQVGDLADTIELPVHMHPKASPAHRLRTAGVWGGWAVAAMVAVAWSIGLRPGDPLIFGSHEGQQAGIGSGVINTAGDALQKYLDLGKKSGSVIGEMPSGIILDKQPLADGSGVETTYLRCIIERIVVRDGDVFQQVENDAGQARIIPAKITPVSNPASPSAPEPLAW